MRARFLTISALSTLVAAALLPGPAPSAAQSLRPPVVQAPGGERGLALVGRRIEGADGTVIDLDLPAGASLQGISELADGWVVTGRVFVAGRSELLVLRDAEGVVELVEEPPARVGIHRASPVALVAGGELAALAWLEGDSPAEAEVRVARFLPGENEPWSAPELAAPRGPSERVALRGAVLADGSWLLLWVGYDGHDDEIYWSRRDPDPEASWSEPRRLAEDNAVPDIAPLVAPAGDGALVAWSRYDGEDYRLRLARFEGAPDAGRWVDLEIEAGKGTSPASFVLQGGRLMLLGKSVLPNGWELRELEPDGAVTREALAPGDYFVPVLRVVEGREAGPESLTARWTLLVFPSYDAEPGATTPQALAPSLGGGRPQGDADRGARELAPAAPPAGVDLELVWSDQP